MNHPLVDVFEATQSGDPSPLFYRKKVSANGEIDEISLGACAVRIARLVIGLIAMVVLLAFGSVDASVFLRFLLRLF